MAVRTKQKSRKRAPPAPAPEEARAPDSKRQRILEAAFSAFMETGYSATSTLEIATRAKVSKRELYALVGDKQNILVCCISERARRMRSASADMPKPPDRQALGRLLEACGLRILTAAADTAVIGMHRLAIAEAARSPEVAGVLQSVGRQANREILKEVFQDARSRGLLSEDPAEMTERFLGLLWGDLMMNLLLDAAGAPGPSELKRRAAYAAKAVLLLDPG